MSTREYPSDAGYTCMVQTGGTKQQKLQHLQMGQASDIGKAPPTRLYTRDYKKVERPSGEADTVSPYVGNPLGR